MRQPDFAASIHPQDLLQRLATAAGTPYRAGSPPASRGFQAPGSLSLRYVDWGGSGATILFLHGGVLTAHTWDLVCLALGERYRCVAMDLRGHGESGWADDYTIDAHCTDVAALVAHLGVAQVHLVGMSLGGNIAAHYAAGAAPRAASLTLVDVGPNVDFNSTAPIRNFMALPVTEMTLEELVDAGMEASSRGVRDKLRYRYLHMTRVDADGRLGWRHDQRRRPDFPHILAKLDELNSLAPRFACPVLTVLGGKSRVLTETKAKAFAERLPRGRWLTIPDAGHNVQEDAPVELAAVLRDFLG